MLWKVWGHTCLFYGIFGPFLSQKFWPPRKPPGHFWWVQMTPTDHPGCIPTRSIEIQPFVVSTATYGPFSQWPLTLWSWFWAKMACISPLLIVPCEATHSKKNFEHYLALLTRPNKDKDKKKEKDKDKKWFYALLGMNIFQEWIFFWSEYFSWATSFQGGIFFMRD